MNVDTDQSSRPQDIAQAIGSTDVLRRLLLSLAEIAEQLRQLHGIGEFHGNVGVATFHNKSDGTLALKPRSESIVITPESSVLLFASGKVGDFDSLTLPPSISEAAGILKQHGIQLDPVRLDLFQFGELLCRHVTGESVNAYLSSPRTMAKVPAPLLPVIDGALGIYPDRTLQTASELAAAIRQAIEACESAQDASLQSTNAGSSVVDAVPPPSSKPELSADLETKLERPKSTHTQESDLPFIRLGHYDILDRVGHGGMGDVYLGYEAELDRHVAIKVLPAEFSREPDFVRRFRREAAAAAKLSHPNIVQIFFAGQDAGHLFFAMQLVDGESLAELLARRPVVPLDQCITLMQQVLAGLSHAHHCGMVHRDIKPGNLLIDHRLRRAMIGDFGLVKSGNAEHGLTATGTVIGTAAYISPEQGRGLPVDHRSDLYSLGVVMYQMLSGRLPFRGNDASSLIFQHVYEAPTRLSEVSSEIPEPLSQIVDRLMAKNPTERYSTADEVIADLRRFQANTPLLLPAFGVGDASQPDSGPSLNLTPRSSGSALATSIIPAPQFPDPPSLPPELERSARPSRLAQLRERILGIVGKAAPGLYEHLLNTQQQVDGAVAEYERRQKVLEEHVRAAEATISELKREQEVWRQAEKSAIARSETVGSETLVSEAKEELIRCSRAISDLQREIEAQQGELQNTHLRLAQVTSTLIRIRSQRDLLHARLKVAQARAQMLGGGKRQKSFRYNVTWAAAGCTIVAAAAWIAITVLSPGTFRGDSGATTASDNPQAGVGATTDVPNSMDSDSFLSEFLLGPETVLDSKAVSFAFDRIQKNASFLTLVVGTQDGTILRGMLYATSGKFTPGKIVGHRKAVTALTFSSDTSLLASGDAGGEIRIWKDSDRTAYRVLQGHTGGISALVFNSDGSKLISMSYSDETIRVWDVLEERELQLIEQPSVSRYTEYPVLFANTPGRNRIIMGPGLQEADGVAYWGQIQGLTVQFSGTEITTVEYKAGRPDARTLKSGRYSIGSMSNSITSWLPSTPNVVQNIGDNIELTALSRDRRSALSALVDGSLVIWNMNDGTEFCRLVDRATANSGLRLPHFRCLAISPDSRIAVSGTDKNRLQIWNLPKLPLPEGQIREFDVSERTGVVRFAPDGTAVAAGCEKGIRYWGLDRNEQYSEHAIKTDSPVSALTFTRDGNSVAYSSGLPRSKSNYVSLQLLPTYAHRFGRGTIKKSQGHTDTITDVALLQNNSVVLSASRDATLRFWSADTGLEIGVLEIGVPINSIAVSPDEQTALVATDDSAIQVVDLASRTVKSTLPGHSFVVLDVNWSPDATQFISAGGDRTVRVWSTETMQTIHVLEGHTDRVNSAVLSGLGKLAISGSDDATVRFWDVTAEQEIAAFRGHSGPVQSVDADYFFSKAVSGSPDETVRVWDLNSAKKQHDEVGTSPKTSGESL